MSDKRILIVNDLRVKYPEQTIRKLVEAGYLVVEASSPDAVCEVNSLPLSGDKVLACAAKAILESTLDDVRTRFAKHICNAILKESKRDEEPNAR